MLPYLQVGQWMLPMYGICMATGLMLTSTMACLAANGRKLPVDDLILYLACIFGGCIIGAKILYNIITFGALGCMRMLANGQGMMLIANDGLVFYGGMFGSGLGIWVGYQLTHVYPSQYCTSLVPWIPLGHAVGRLGCFFAGCCYGVEYHGWGGVCFPHAISGLAPDVPVIPTQLWEMVGNIMIFFWLFSRYAREEKESWKPMRDYLMAYAILRFFVEFFRGDEIRGHVLFLSSSQMISCVAIIILALFEFGMGGKPLWIMMTGCWKRSKHS